MYFDVKKYAADVVDKFSENGSHFHFHFPKLFFKKTMTNSFFLNKIKYNK